MREVDQRLQALEDFNKRKLEKLDSKLRQSEHHRGSTLKQIDSFFEELVAAAELRCQQLKAEFKALQLRDQRAIEKEKQRH